MTKIEGSEGEEATDPGLERRRCGFGNIALSPVGVSDPPEFEIVSKLLAGR